MKTVAEWIDANKTKLPDYSKVSFQEVGFKIENVIAPVFETYALVYHPYKIPDGKIITEKEQREIESKLFIKRVNSMIERETGISARELPSEDYDYESVIRKKMSLQNRDEKTINETLSKIQRESVKLIFEPIQRIIDSGGEITEKKISLREISWAELYEFYGIEFNNKASWGTISQKVKADNRVYGQDMPEMDYIPKKIIDNIHDFLRDLNVEKIEVNSQRSVKPETVSISELKNLQTVTFIASPEKKWVFICPRDFCRTIVAGTTKFVKQVIASKLFEVSSIIDANHRLDFYA